MRGSNIIDTVNTIYARACENIFNYLTFDKFLSIMFGNENLRSFLL